MSSEIQADGADHMEGQNVIEEIVDMEVNYPDWYLENYEFLKKFLALTDEGRSELVGEASGIFGTVLASLSPEGTAALTASGDAFARANYETLQEKFGNTPGNEFLLLIIGVAVECLGIQQLKIQEAKKS